ncbi:hypothetical protein JRQ81_009108 [Phrynocephalus forsythii]|uniref:Uncharacterized protein n=1 Tax=Phrynocephalus forsythii TaxID=171643 RepID=A0A9Q0X9S9_9SAUR|nr:hypothetical protein JRQ81_009108 [Phrynocephalus forsythii]
MARELPESLQQSLEMMGDPRPAMASLVLAWVLFLSLVIPRVTPQDACEPQLRYRQGSPESASSWISTVALLSSICATWVFAFYALQCLCAKKDLCGKEPEAECETSWEVRKECGAEATPDACGVSQALACPQPRSGSHKPPCSQVQQAYAHQLACMEEELGNFLHEVKSRRYALGEILQDEQYLAKLKRDADKLRITIYEIADCEGASQAAEERGRKRKLR